MNNFFIRSIEERDNTELAVLIRTTLAEFGANLPGFAFTDSELDAMYAMYSQEKHVYLVIERSEDGKIVGGAGIGPLAGGDMEICELRKMYFLPEIRGIGLSSVLANDLFERARSVGYKRCYLETLKSMTQANAFYKKIGFMELQEPQGSTGHYGCDCWYAKDL